MAASDSPTDIANIGVPVPVPQQPSPTQSQRRNGKRPTNEQAEANGTNGAEGAGEEDVKRRRLSGEDAAADLHLVSEGGGGGGGGDESYEGDEHTLQTIAVGLEDPLNFDNLVETTEADLFHLLNTSEPPRRWDLIAPEDQLNIKKLTETFLLQSTYKDETNPIGISRSFLYFLYRVCVPRGFFDMGSYMSRIKFNHIVTQIYGKQKTAGDKEKRSRRTINKETDLPLLFPSLKIELTSIYRERIPYYPNISLRPQFIPISESIANTEAFKTRLLEEILNRSKDPTEGPATSDGSTQASSSSSSSSSPSSSAVISSPHHFRQPKEQPWYSIWEVPSRNKICVLFTCPLIDPAQLKFSFISDTEITVFLENATTVFARFQPNDTHRFVSGVEQWPLPFPKTKTIRLPFAIEEPREDNFVFAQHGGVVLSLQRKRVGQSARVVTPKVNDWNDFDM